MMETGWFSTNNLSVGYIKIGTDDGKTSDEALPPETRVAYHDIFRKRLTVGTKAGAMRIALADRLADQERTIDHVLAAFQKNGNLARLEDKDKLASDDEDG